MTDDPLLWATVGLVVATAGLVHYTAQLVRVTRRLASSSERLEAAHGEHFRLSGPMLSVVDPTFVRWEVEPRPQPHWRLHFRFWVRNAGRMPARFDLSWASWEGGASTEVLDVPEGAESRAIPANEITSAIEASVTLVQEEVDRFLATRDLEVVIRAPNGLESRAPLRVPPPPRRLAVAVPG